MTHHSLEIYNGKVCLQYIQRIGFPVLLILVILAPIPLFSSLPPSFVLWRTSKDSSPGVPTEPNQVRQQNCDLFKGEWVPNAESPYYTNESCWAIHEHENCMKYGRPDSDYLKWRWNPDTCELPVFDPWKFFQLVRGKSMAFVGDSVARNHMQSLMCLLSRVEHPIDSSKGGDERFKRWHYTTSNFTIQAFWSTFLVKAKEVDEHRSVNNGLCSLYLDEVDELWSSKIHEFDHVIISDGNWFYRPLHYYESGVLVGCYNCQDKNLTKRKMTYGYGRAFRTAFKTINGLTKFNGVTYLRTFSPSHFEGGLWNTGGNCSRTRPFRGDEKAVADQNLEPYMAQLEEFMVAEKEGQKRGLKFRLLDITRAMLLRPDGHPGRYGHFADENATRYINDCVHWCLPGPIDYWNELLLELMKRDNNISRSA